jgi:hypothetical protein
MGKSTGLTLFLIGIISLILSSCSSSGSSPSPTANYWTFLAGNTTTDVPGSYNGATPPAGGWPGGRFGSVSWTDGNNLWLFGGYGYDLNTGEYGYLNDLWLITISPPASGIGVTGVTWVSGSSTIDQPGTYNGIGSAGTPGARYGAVSWFDGSNLWLFGGNGYASPLGTPEKGYLNDLWKGNYNSITQTFTWTWVSGSDIVNQAGTYSGTEVPGSRYDAVSWFDGSNLWLFGGRGYDVT